MVETGSLILIAVLLTAASAPADPPQPPPVLMRVDQAVADLDRLSVSLRTIEPGLHIPTEQSALFVGVPQPTDMATALYTTPLAGPQPYYRMGPGFRARVDRLDYLIVVNSQTHETARDITPVHDGQYFDVAPANMVYELTPYFPKVTTPDKQARLAASAPTSEPAAWIDHRLPPLRIENRVERRIEPLRIDTRIDTQVNPKP